MADVVVRRCHGYRRHDRIGNPFGWRQDQPGKRELRAQRTDCDRRRFRRHQFGRRVRRVRFLDGWKLGGAWSVVIAMVIGVGRVGREMTVDGPAIVMAGLVLRVRVQMDERRRQGAHLQAETHEQHEAEALHVCRIVAHTPKVVKDAARLGTRSLETAAAPLATSTFWHWMRHSNALLAGTQ